MAVLGDRRVEERSAVLGDVHRQIAVGALEPQQQIGKPLREHFPAGFGIGAQRLAHRAGLQRIAVVGLGDAAGVVVDADEIQRLHDQLEVFGIEVRPGVAEDLLQLRRIAAEQGGVQVLLVHVGMRALRRRLILGAVGGLVFRFDIYHQTDLVLALGAICLHRGTVRAHQVVRGDRRFVLAAVTGCQRAVQIAAVGDHPGFVERHPLLHPAVERAVQHRAVFGEPVGAVAVEPAALVVQRRRHVPVIQREQRFDAVGQQFVDQLRVEIDARLVHPADALRQDPRPRHAEAVSLQAQIAHQLHVVLPAPVVIAGDVAGIAVEGHAGRVREARPDAGAGAIGQRRALDLMRSGGRAPQKAGWKLVGLGMTFVVGLRHGGVPRRRVRWHDADGVCKRLHQDYIKLSSL